MVTKCETFIRNQTVSVLSLKSPSQTPHSLQKYQGCLIKATRNCSRFPSKRHTPTLTVAASSHGSKYLNLKKFFPKEQISTGKEFRLDFLTLGQSFNTKLPERAARRLCLRRQDRLNKP